MIKMNLEITKIIGQTNNNTGTSRDKAIKSAMTSIKETIKTIGTKTSIIIIEFSIKISIIDNKWDMKMTGKIRIGLEKENRKIGINNRIIIIIITKITIIHKSKHPTIGVNMMKTNLLQSITIWGNKKLMLDKINNEKAFVIISAELKINKKFEILK